MNVETLHVDTYFEMLQDMDFNKSADGYPRRKIEFEYDNKEFIIEQEMVTRTIINGQKVTTISTFYQRDRQFHRLGGPAVIQNEGNPNKNIKCNFGWAIDGTIYEENEYNFWVACFS